MEPVDAEVLRFELPAPRSCLLTPTPIPSRCLVFRSYFQVLFFPMHRLIGLTDRGPVADHLLNQKSPRQQHAHRHRSSPGPVTDGRPPSVSCLFLTDVRCSHR